MSRRGVAAALLLDCIMHSFAHLQRNTKQTRGNTLFLNFVKYNKSLYNILKTKLMFKCRHTKHFTCLFVMSHFTTLHNKIEGCHHSRHHSQLLTGIYLIYLTYACKQFEDSYASRLERSPLALALQLKPSIPSVLDLRPGRRRQLRRRLGRRPAH